MVLYQIRYSLSSKPWSNNLERKFSQEVGREKDMERELRLSHCAAASSLVTRQNERISPLPLLIFHCQKGRLTMRASIFWHDLAKTYWHHLQTHIQPRDLRTSCNTAKRSPLDFIPTNLFSTMSILPTPWRPLKHEGKNNWDVKNDPLFSPGVTTVIHHWFIYGKNSGRVQSCFFFHYHATKKVVWPSLRLTIISKMFFNVMRMSTFLFTLNVAWEKLLNARRIKGQNPDFSSTSRSLLISDDTNQSHT